MDPCLVSSKPVISHLENQPYYRLPAPLSTSRRKQRLRNRDRIGLYRPVSAHISDSCRYVPGLERYGCEFHSHRYTGEYPNRRYGFPVRIGRFYAAELVYRDLKPENVLVQESGHLMLVHFDLSTKLFVKSPQTLPTVKSVPMNKKRPFSCCNSGISPEEDLAENDAKSASSSELDSVEKSNSGRSGSSGRGGRQRNPMTRRRAD
ncbi:unnamed protein product [Camellia sinensis]